jgi:hypothetical protein
VPQVLFVQVATVFGPVAEQSFTVQQPEELIHVLLNEQYFCPAGHVPLQAAFWAIHVPLQFCGRLVGQRGTHAVPFQLTVPPTGIWQAVAHSVRPQVAALLLLAHRPLQLCQLALQRTAQLPF